MSPAERLATYQHADLMTLLANVYRDAKKRPQPFAPNDFLPAWARVDVAPLSDEELLAKVIGINAQFGGVIA